MTEAQANAQGYFLHLGSEGGVCGRPLRWFVYTREGFCLQGDFTTQADALRWLSCQMEEPGDWHDEGEEGLE